MHRLLLLLLSLLVSFSFFMTALSSVASATPIAITDPSFENNGQGWSTVGTSGFITGSMSEGVWSGYTNGPNGILYQLLSSTISSGNAYTLTVDLGQYYTFTGGEGSFYIYSPGSGLATPLTNANGTAAMMNVAAPEGPCCGPGGSSGNYSPNLSVTYTALASGDPFEGYNLGIALMGSAGIQVLWDNVRMEVTPIPEPSTSLLLGLGLVGLASRRSRE